MEHQIVVAHVLRNYLYKEGYFPPELIKIVLKLLPHDFRHFKYQRVVTLSKSQVKDLEARLGLWKGITSGRKSELHFRFGKVLITVKYDGIISAYDLAHPDDLKGKARWRTFIRHCGATEFMDQYLAILADDEKWPYRGRLIIFNLHGKMVYQQSFPDIDLDGISHVFFWEFNNQLLLCCDSMVHVWAFENPKPHRRYNRLKLGALSLLICAFLYFLFILF